MSKDKVELSFDSKQNVKVMVEYLQMPFKIKAMRENLAEIKRQRNQELLEEIAENGLV